ncbi:hypothetical protein QTO34_010583 [Cnephaeus nilssonii]|uniref:Uncharacterized protein n=1 Tax=Cnephaeus nilssonii TaxID=3371016 RepID=A0AA40HFU4_CNENI|nr:hypothetical protein QTO34_010583 [Eptesicus nilssonii]
MAVSESSPPSHLTSTGFHACYYPKWGHQMTFEVTSDYYSIAFKSDSQRHWETLRGQFQQRIFQTSPQKSSPCSPLMGTGVLTAVGTGGGGISASVHLYHKLSAEFSEGVSIISNSLESLQRQVDALAAVALQNRCALDLLTAEKGECCYLVNESGVVKDHIKSLWDRIDQRRRNQLEGGYAIFGSLTPWLLPLLGPLVFILLILLFGPCLMRCFTSFFGFFFAEQNADVRQPEALTPETLAQGDSGAGAGAGAVAPGHQTSQVPPINHFDSLPPAGLRWLQFRKGRIRPTGAGSESTPGRLPPRTPTCPPRRRSTRPARPASPRPAVRGQCAGAAADASVYVRARRWRRRGKQREESGERQGSLKRAAMALRSPQVAAGPCPRLEGAPRRGGRAAGRAAGERPHPGPERGVWEWGRAPGHAAWD